MNNIDRECSSFAALCGKGGAACFAKTGNDLVVLKKMFCIMFVCMTVSKK